MILLELGPCAEVDLHLLDDRLTIIAFIITRPCFLNIMFLYRSVLQSGFQEGFGGNLNRALKGYNSCPGEILTPQS